MKNLSHFALLLSFAAFATLAQAGVVDNYLSLATHKAYLGHCDDKKVMVTVYRIPSGVVLEEFAMMHREVAGIVPKLFTVEIPPHLQVADKPPSRFFVVNSGKESEHRWQTVYENTKRTLPNLYNRIRAEVGFGIGRNGEEKLMNHPGEVFPNDCKLVAESDATWIPMTRADTNPAHTERHEE